MPSWGEASHIAWGLGPGAWVRLGLLLTWGAAMPFWNSVSLLDKKLAAPGSGL